jgi:hypothetical protein
VLGRGEPLELGFGHRFSIQPLDQRREGRMVKGRCCRFDRNVAANEKVFEYFVSG